MHLYFQARFHPNPHYMKKQQDITEGMRCILVDWLVEVTEEFKLDQQTLYMALSIVDRYLQWRMKILQHLFPSNRFLSSMSVMRSKLQLVGGTAIYIASKFEEIFPPEIADFAYITDDTYTKSQIVYMEREVLKVLDFNLAGPTAHNFLLRYLKASEADSLELLQTNPNRVSSSTDVTADAETISQNITALSMVIIIFRLIFLFQQHPPPLLFPVSM